MLSSIVVFGALKQDDRSFKYAGENVNLNSVWSAVFKTLHSYGDTANGFKMVVVRGASAEIIACEVIQTFEIEGYIYGVSLCI